MKVGREKYLRKVQNQTHNNGETQKPGMKTKKSGQESYRPIGFLQMLSILRMSLSNLVNLKQSRIG
jgi:hypothetical protein